MNIVYVSREYPPSARCGGIGSYVRNTARAMCKRGHCVTVICASDDTRRQYEYVDKGVRVIRLSGGDFVVPTIEGHSIWKKMRIFYRFFSYRRKVLRAIQSLNRVDVIETPEYGAEGVYASLFPAPCVIRMHAPAILDIRTGKAKKYGFSRMPWRWLACKEIGVIQKACYITSCSHHLAIWISDFLKKTVDGVNVIHNFIDVPFWSKKISCEKDYDILYFGTISETKGVCDLLEAVRILRSWGKDIQLCLAGRGGADIKESYAADTWCHFLGAVEHDRLRMLMAKSRIVCLPSWWENFPMSCLEAMAAGCIVIGTTCGGFSEIIESGKNGFLVPPKSPQLLADQILKTMLLSQTVLADIATSAQNTVNQKYSEGVVACILETYYKKIIEN